MSAGRARRVAASDDSGSVLVIALVIVTVVALVVGSLLAYADTSMRTTVALRAQSTAAATADGAAQAAVNALRQNAYNNDGGSSTYPKCFGAGANDDVLVLPDFLPGGTGAPANSAAVRCAPDPTTGADGVSVPITSANKPGNAILTVGINPAENGLEVKALNTALPFNVHGGIVSNSNIAVTDGTLKSTVDVWANTGCTGTIISTPAPVCDHATVPVPDYAPEATTVPTLATVPTACPAGVATFEPGYYNDASALSAFMGNSSACKNSVWWFKPGEYYFDFQNTGSHQWQVSTGQLLAGTPVDADGDPIAAPSKPVSVPGACDNPIKSETAVGVQFIFGGDSQFQVAGTADAEICGTYRTNRPPLAIYGVRASGTVTTGGGTGKTAATVTTSGFAPAPVTTPATTAADALAAAGDGKTLTWTGTSGTPMLNATAFAPSFSIPAGSTLTSAKAYITYATGTTAVNKRELVVTPTPGTALGTKTLMNGVPSTTAPLQVDLTADLASTVSTKGLTELALGYKVTKTGTGAATDSIDAITLDLAWTGPAMRAQSGCITQVYSGGSGCAVISTTESYSGQFYIQGTTYVPLAPVDISLSNITAQVLRFGVISRVLRVKETGAVSYSGPVIEIPDDSPGYGPGGTVVHLKVYVCEGQSTCTPVDPATGAERKTWLRVRAYIKDAGAVGPAGGREMVVQSWAVQR